MAMISEQKDESKGPSGSMTAVVRAASAALAVLVCAAIVLAVDVREKMPDFSALEAGAERKSAFFDFARPLVRDANQAVRADRARLEKIAADREPGWLDRRWLRSLAEHYRLDADALDIPQLIDRLLLRVDAVPASLALAQAAKESGWGTSRFARDGYNLYGEWCYEPGCGLVPRQRTASATHEVEAFQSPRRSVESYIHNINTHDAYRDFREARLALRRAGRPLSGIALAETLSSYSERRGEYVDEIRRLIIANGLEQADARSGG
jgi:Bax protein